VFAGIYPQLAVLDVMGLSTPRSAVLSALIFNALILVALIPLALRGVRYVPLPAATALRRNLVIFGGGGVIVPFAGIKLIDMALAAMGLA
jgi:K+-transporting ATPase ATPase B chain